MGIEALRLKVESVVNNIDGLNTFVFDVLSEVNNGAGYEYPLCLLKCPERSVLDDYRKDWETYSIELYCFTPMLEEDNVALLWDELKGYLSDILYELRILPNEYRIQNNKVSWTYGQYQYNDLLATVRCNVELSVFECATI